MQKYTILVLMFVCIVLVGCKRSEGNSVAEQASNESEDVRSTTPQKPDAMDLLNIVEANGIDPSVTTTDPNNSAAKLIVRDVNTTNASIDPNIVYATVPENFYEQYEKLLSEYVGEKGNINFSKLRRGTSKQKLYQITNSFDELKRKDYEKWSDNDKTAFWVNVYNTNMLRIIINNFPIESSKFERMFRYRSPNDLRYIQLAIGEFEKQKLMALDEEFTVSDVEEKILSGRLNRPEAVFALYHGAVSGPTLLNKPYEGTTFDSQLKEQIKRVLSEPKAYRIDKEKKRLYLHAIMQRSWQGKYFTKKYKITRKFKDFPDYESSILNFLSNYISEADVKFIELEQFKIIYEKYNWELAGQ